MRHHQTGYMVYYRCWKNQAKTFLHCTSNSGSSWLAILFKSLLRHKCWIALWNALFLNIHKDKAVVLKKLKSQLADDGHKPAAFRLLFQHKAPCTWAPPQGSLPSACGALTPLYGNQFINSKFLRRPMFICIKSTIVPCKNKKEINVF